MNRIDYLWKFISNFYNELPKSDYLIKCKGHGKEHILRVVRNSIDLYSEEISKSKSINLDLVLSSALLHDIDYINGVKGHVVRSAEKSVQILKQTGMYSSLEIEEIREIILSHSLKIKRPSNYNEIIIYLSDKLDLLGYEGILRRILYLSNDFDNIYDVCTKIKNDADRIAKKDLLSFNFGIKLINQKYNELTNFIDNNIIKPDFNILIKNYV